MGGAGGDREMKRSQQINKRWDYDVLYRKAQKNGNDKLKERVRANCASPSRRVRDDWKKWMLQEIDNSIFQTGCERRFYWIFWQKTENCNARISFIAEEIITFSLFSFSKKNYSDEIALCSIATLPRCRNIISPFSQFIQNSSTSMLFFIPGATVHLRCTIFFHLVDLLTAI